MDRAIALHQSPGDESLPGKDVSSDHQRDFAASSPLLGIGISPSSTAYSIFDEFANDPRFLKSQQEFRSLLFTSALSAAPTRQGSPVHDAILDHQSGDALSSIVSTGPRIIWLRNYLDEVAPWLDMFDQEQMFGQIVPVLAKSSVPLTYAILAISARQMERVKKLKGDHDSLQLYQEAIRSLTPYLLACDPNIMATCVILCCLEMMSASPKNWRKHLDGCATLFESYNIHGFSGGVPQAVFWCYARMDLCAAIISDGDHSTVLPLRHWTPSGLSAAEVYELFRLARSPDMWANYAVYLTAKVSDFIWAQTKNMAPSDPGSFSRDWLDIWAELQSWRQNRPAELLEFDFLGDDDNSANSPFPFVIFAVPCAISSNQLYHTACLLLLDLKPPSIDISYAGSSSVDLWHARRICGISSSNEHHGCLNNAIQPLWVAGRLLSHPTEHRAVVNLIKRIELVTGWGTTWRITDLMGIWGYTSNDFM
ncbi:Fungal specific transcription factor domain containing protein [Hyaloscypha variabilis]